jgi:hypothetical protein
MKNVILIASVLAAGIGLELTSPAPEPKSSETVPTEKHELLCPVVGDGRTYISQTSEPTEVRMEYIHCRKCEIGALFPLEADPNTGRCSYCHEEYPDAFNK